MTDIGFVILHYKAVNTTIRSIESVLSCCDSEDFAIIIVDNASPDGSGDVLRKKYQQNEKVTVLKAEQNLGFTGGNNLGFRYAKQQLHCSYIVLMNNDIYLTCNHFYQTVHEDYREYQYDVLGPRIYGKGTAGEHGAVSPLFREYSMERLKTERMDCRMYLAFSKVHLERIYEFFRFRCYGSMKAALKGSKNDFDEIPYARKQFHVALQGSIWVFSPKYVSRFDGLDEVTFMYHEEEVLWNQIRRINGLMMYEPFVTVYHDHEASSSRNVSSTLRKSRIEKYKRMLQSTEAMLQYYENNQQS